MYKEKVVLVLAMRAYRESRCIAPSFLT
jgi:hypothetical protein